MDFRRCAQSNAVVPLCYTCVTVQGDGQDLLKVEEAAAGTNEHFRRFGLAFKLVLFAQNPTQCPRDGQQKQEDTIP